MKKILFIVFVLIFYSISHAFALKDCKMLLFSKRYKQAIKACDKSILENHKNGYLYLGKIYLDLSQPSTALAFFKRYKQLSTKASTIGKAYRYMAISYLSLYLHYKFLYYKDNSINMPLNGAYQTNLYTSMNNLVALHLIQKLFKKTISYFHKSLQISPASFDGKIFNDLSYAYFFANNIKKAIFFEKKAIKNAQANRNLKSLPLYLLNLSYFKFVEKRVYNAKSNIWQESYINFLANVKKYAIQFSVSNKSTQISKIIDNVIKSN